MHSPLSWRWPWWWWGCYAWCTSRIPFGATLWFSVSWGGASLVRLASSTRDRFGSPQLEPGSLLPRLGFHPKSEGYSVGALGLGHPWRLSSTLRGPWLGLPSNTRDLLPVPAALHDRCIGTLLAAVHPPSPLGKPLVMPSWLRAVQHPWYLCAPAKVPVSSAGCSPR
ncbi:hypothetical protein V6N13_037360 [Hibiscus sabdariffa]